MRQKNNILELKNDEETWILVLNLKKDRFKFYCSFEIFADWIKTDSKYFKYSEIRLIQNDDLIFQLEKVCERLGHELSEKEIKKVEKKLDQLRNDLQEKG